VHALLELSLLKKFEWFESRGDLPSEFVPVRKEIEHRVENVVFVAFDDERQQD